MDAIQVDGATLAADECGTGDPWVLVHGSASDRRSWAAQRDAWCDDHRVVTYSRRYHWPNEPIESGATFSLEEQVADLGRVLETVADEPVVLIGHSYGGLIALLAAARRPDRVRALVAAEPPMMGLFGHVPPRPLELLKLALRRPATAFGIVKLGAGALGPAEKALRRGDTAEAKERMGLGILGREAYEGLSEERRAQVEDNIMVEELSSPETFPPLDTDEIRSMRCPTLLVGGDRSPAVFGRFLDALEGRLPHAERVTIPGASHLTHEDNPERFNAAVESFLARVRRAGG